MPAAATTTTTTTTSSDSELAQLEREIHTVHAANQRLDDDAMLAFNAEILAFAKSNHIEIGPQRSRHSSPARVETPVRRHH